MEQDEIKNLYVLSIPEGGYEGYFLEVDLEYPPEIHDDHNDLSFYPEQLKTSANKSASKKLIGTLHDKKKYVVHHRYL